MADRKAHQGAEENNVNILPTKRVRSRPGPIFSVEIDHEIIPTIVLLPPLIQEGLLSVTSERMCMKYWSTAWSSLPRKKCG